ncbi:beta-1,3-galactosyltransferase 1-like [Aphidius gifuensis]|uniref:beta-1,3-galactosyltransferase 1-like n=1 Tax=Aphidius gifuensis TaxID=684658 RepID=UPI001CDC9979|nr:beta-1,3-galactosyltransferase 1-like [Aphidius gifuensis]
MVKKNSRYSLEIWPYDKPRNLFVYVKPYEVTTTIEPIKQYNHSEIFLNIIVITALNHEDRRIAIRQTWASKKRINNKKIAVNFLNLLKQESDKYGDIIQEPFIDSYYNLTIKVGMMLKWIKNNYPDTRYILKADDDVYIDIPNLLKNLSQHENSSELLLMGQLNTLSLPNRDQYNKWYMPNYMYSESTYPPYLDGPAYIMSQAVLNKLYEKALSLPILHLEDLFFTGICAREANIDPINNKNFGFFAEPLGLIMKHGITIAEMNRMWKNRSQLNNYEN